MVDLPIGLNFLNTLRPVKFKWATRDGNVKDGKIRAGFIAQELEKVLPNCVNTNEMGIKNVNVDNILYYLINSIKELSTKVTALEGK